MSRRGFTLTETLLVVVIIGMVTLITLPRVRRMAARNGLRASRNTLIGLYSQSRLIAMQQGRWAGLRFDGNNVFVTAWWPGVGTYDTVGVVRNLADEFGVTVGSDQSPIAVDPKGFSSAAAMVWATRDGHA